MRIFRLAAYAEMHPRFGLAELCRDVPDYELEGPIRDGERGYEAIRKMIQRDLDELAESWGIRIAYHRGGGVDSYVRQPPFFTTAERRALIAAAAAVRAEGLEGLGPPGEVGSEVDDRYSHIVIRVQPLVVDLRAAIADRAPVAFTYEGEERHVEPWALGVWRNHWYLVGRDRDRDGERKFRLDRIDGGVRGGDETASYELPDTFDADRAFDLDPNAWGHDPCVRTTVRVRHDHLPAFLRELGGNVTGNVIGEELDSDGVLVALEVRHYESFRNRVLAFRGNAVVFDPPAMVALMRDHLAALAGGS